MVVRAIVEENTMVVERLVIDENNRGKEQPVSVIRPAKGSEKMEAKGERTIEREILLAEIRYSGLHLLMKLGKEIGDSYCLQFNDDGYDQQYNRFDNRVAIPKIADAVTDDQLVSFFASNPAKGYTFRGQYYTLRDGALALETEWPAIKEELWRLSGKHPPGSVAAVLGACYAVCVQRGMQRNNYLHVQSVAKELGAGNFRDALTVLELAGVVIRNKGDIRVPPELVPLVEKFIRGACEQKEEQRAEEDRRLEAPDSLFEDIIGHEDTKELLRACLMAEKPVHVLLAGPPALAKTLFLWDIESAGGEKAVWLVGSGTSKGGLWDLVADRQPQILLIDEMDKMDAADTAALLSLMEGGRLVRTKVGRELNLRQEIRVVAACNQLKKLSPELLSRFVVRNIQSYSREDYLAVVKGVLAHREGVDEATAGEIARRLDGITQDVRAAVNVARLVPRLGVEKAVKFVVERRW